MRESPPNQPAMDPAVARLLERQRPVAVVEPPLWREPLRLLVILSTPLILVTTNLPWLHQEGIGQTEVLSGNSGYADGALLTFVAIVASVVVANRDVARSRTWFLRWLPAFLGVVGGLFVLSGVRNMENQIAIWRRFGASGVYEPGFFAFVAVGLVFAAAAIVIGTRRGLAHSTDGVRNERLVIRRRPVISSLFGLAGVVLGILGGAALALQLDLPAAAIGVPLLALSVIGGTIGAVVAGRLRRSLLPDRPPVRPPTS